jgi:hypothetical protein
MSRSKSETKIKNEQIVTAVNAVELDQLRVALAACKAVHQQHGAVAYAVLSSMLSDLSWAELPMEWLYGRSPLTQAVANRAGDFLDLLHMACVVCGEDRNPSPSRSIELVVEEHLDRLVERKSNGNYAHTSCAKDLGDAIGVAGVDQKIAWTEHGCMPVGEVEI